jgi:cysteine desulfurase/selenocysteine lyase
MRTATRADRQTDPESNVGRFDAYAVRRDFPALQQQVHGKPLVYLDNAATTQKPRAVLDAIVRFYECDNSNIHRGVHLLSQRATDAYERVRARVGRFLNAREAREIVFVRGTTEAVNLVAQSFARPRLREGDEILISEMEHHSNIVPWQLVCGATGARLRVVPVNDAGELRWDEYERLLGARTRLVAVAHVSNALGTVNPVQRIVELAHGRGVPVLVDGAQAAPHLRVDVQALDCDFYAFSGHKTYGPTGIGALYGKAEHLEAMPPYHGGGDMILSVSFDGTTYNAVPFKFEAGTPNIEGVIGLGAALDYLDGLGWTKMAKHEAELLDGSTRALSALPGVRLVGTAKEKTAVLSFVMEGVHPHDVGTILDHEGVAIRTGHHCAQPLMRRFGVSATARASLALYNTWEDVEALVKGIYRVREVFG